MDEQEIKELWSMSEEELEEKYRDILRGFSGDPKQVSDPTTRAIHDFAEHADISERKKFLLTIIFQHDMINKLNEMLVQKELEKPPPIPFEKK